MQEQEMNAFVNQNILSEGELQTNRVKLNLMGHLYGKRLAIPMSENCDLIYRQKLQNGQLTTSTPVKKYLFETIDIVAMDLVKTPNGPVIQLNGDTNLQFPLRDGVNKLANPTEQDIYDAIRLYETSKKKSVFSDVRLVSNCITSLNKANASAIETLIDDLADQASALETLNTTLAQDTESYYNSISEG